MYTDMSVYRIICEIVREKILLKTRDEIPHSVAVEIIDVEEERMQRINLILTSMLKEPHKVL